MIALTLEGRTWAESHDLNVMADVVLDPPGRWPEGFVRLATRYANDAGAVDAVYEALRRLIQDVGPEKALAAIRVAEANAVR